MIKRVIDKEQTCDMGSGWGHLEIPLGTSVEEVLDWIKKNNKTWGTITIISNKQVARKFDYDLWNSKKIFYHHLSGWEYNSPVRAVDFTYCFMGEDITIYVGDR